MAQRWYLETDMCVLCYKERVTANRIWQALGSIKVDDAAYHNVDGAPLSSRPAESV